MAAGNIADIAYALNHLVLDERSHVLDHLRLIYAVRDLGNDYFLTPGLFIDDHLGFAAHSHLPAPEFVHRGNSVAAADCSPSREIGTFYKLHQIVNCAGIAVLDVVIDAVAKLAEVMRRNIRRHTDGNAGRAVEKKVGKAPGKNDRLFQSLVEVGHHIDRIFFKVAQKLLRNLLHAHFRVTHGGRRVAVNRAEVAVPVNKRVAQREILREADDGVVDGRIAVGVIFTDNFTDHTGGLHMLGVERSPQLMHRKKAPAVNRLETVTDIGKRTPDDDAHGVVDIISRHLLFYFDIIEHSALRNPGKLHLIFLTHIPCIIPKKAPPEVLGRSTPLARS